MGLDVYVGSLTRYYTGDWETILQRTARERGVPFQTIRLGPGRSPQPAGPAPLRDAEGVRAAVLAWRAAVSSGLSALLDAPLAWEESPDSAYFTDKPGWHGYASLLLLAAHDEHPELPPPAAAEGTWDADPAWRACSARGFRGTRYKQILAPELWLPREFGFVFQARDPAGREVYIGSSTALRAQLQALNTRTFGGSAQELAGWRHGGARPGDPFAAAARFALAVFLELAGRSVAAHLPIKLDY